MGLSELMETDVSRVVLSSDFSEDVSREMAGQPRDVQTQSAVVFFADPRRETNVGLQHEFAVILHLSHLSPVAVADSYIVRGARYRVVKLSKPRSGSVTVHLMRVESIRSETRNTRALI